VRSATALSASHRYRLDVASGRLSGETGDVLLQPKVLGVLVELASNAGTAVTREHLNRAIWPDVLVSDAALRYSIRQVRRALGDSMATPVWVETVPRRGWRFLGRVTRAEGGTWSLEPGGPTATTLDDAAPCVGRADELLRLDGWLAEAQSGRRRMAFVTGEAGIGKTRLVSGFLARHASDPNLRIAHGQCIEHYGPGEAYLPVLEALTRLCEELDEEAGAAVLRRHAPMWLAQLPSLTAPGERDALERSLAGATQERMLREGARALEALAATHPLILWIDDLHWSDVSTVELLSVVARRAEPARLLVVCTYRPAEVAGGREPLASVVRDLQRQGRCVELPVPSLDVAAVEEYLGRRCGFRETSRSAADADTALARALHDRTDGNPLFLVSVVDDLLDRGLLVQDETGWSLAVAADTMAAPRTVRQLLESELDRVDAGARDLLEIASLAGMEFSAAAVAAAGGTTVDAAEAACEALARQGRFLRACGSERWPDGTLASRYAFLHALHREVLAGRVPAARRAHAHRALGLRKEAAWPAPGEIAAELARHFEAGGETARAVRYLGQAGERAARRYANAEAADHLRHALALLDGLPPGPERDTQELTLRLGFSVPLAATRGYAAPELADNMARIQTLYRDLDESSDLVPVMLGLWSLHVLRAELGEARGLAAALLRIAERGTDPGLGLQAHRVLGHTLFYTGELVPAADHLERALAHHDPYRPRQLDPAVGDDPVVLSLSYSAWVLWFRGRPDAALARIDEAVAEADALAHPPSQAFARSYAAVLHQLRRDPARARLAAERVLALAEREGFFLWNALGTIVDGWARASEGATADGIARMQQGLAAWELSGARLGLPHFTCALAGACLDAGRLDEVEALLERAGADIPETGQLVFEPERLRLAALLAVRRAGEDGREDARRLARDAEGSLREAVALADAQGSRALALRAATALARLLLVGGRSDEARAVLAPLAASIGEGHETADVADAAAVLADAAPTIRPSVA